MIAATAAPTTSVVEATTKSGDLARVRFENVTPFRERSGVTRKADSFGQGDDLLQQQIVTTASQRENARNRH